MITAAGKMLMTLGRGMLRQTKHLSPYKSTKGKKGFSALGKYTNKGMQKVGFSATNRAKTIAGLNTGFKHVRKHKKRYGSAVAGAAVWDIMDNDNT